MHRLAAISLAVLLIASGSALPGVSLCLGADGHVAVEGPATSCCGPAGDNCAESCVDTSIAAWAEVPVAAAARTSAAPALLIAAEPPTASAHGALAARFADRSAPPAPPPRDLRSTVHLL